MEIFCHSDDNHGPGTDRLYCVPKKGYRPVDKKDVLNLVREEGRERPDNHFAEIYLRTVWHAGGGTDVSEVITDILNRDEVRIKDRECRLIAPVERRRSD
jgi:hypothetical protein